VRLPADPRSCEEPDCEEVSNFEKTCCLLLAAGILHSPLWGQMSVRQQLLQAISLQKQGHFDKVIETLPAITGSDSLTLLEKGQTWTILGFAYEEKGDFNRAQDAYEKALNCLAGKNRYAVDLAIALETLANLYGDMGRLEDATNVALKALHVFQRVDNEAGIARSCVRLANLWLARKRLRKCEPYLTVATKQAARAPGLDDDFYAGLASTQAWQDALKGKAIGAVSGYQCALDIWRRAHGHRLGLILLGNTNAHAGNKQIALDDMREGLEILDRTLGPRNPKYLLAELAYSRTMEQAGELDQATILRERAEKELTAFAGGQCINCRILVDDLP
jgi:tetratricopeptide (TPR) repeat protein